MTRACLIVIILFLFSCSGKDGSEGKGENEPAINPGLSELSKIDVPLLEANNFQSLITEHKGKVLFINTWATWCVPCKEEFPDLVRLHEYYKNSDVVFVGISVDYKEDIESKIKPFLISQNAKFKNYVQNFKEPANLINLMNEDWQGAVPATFIYDRQGQQQAYLLGKHSFEEFKEKIEEIREIN
jgi:thiol-disulfide isomerase/thioredoxin